MPGKSSIPADVLAFVPCRCCRVRDDNGTFRVYKYSSVKLPSGKWSSDYGHLIGKILPGKGFVANKRYLKELEKEGHPVFPDGITDVAYGQYALLMHLSSDIFQMLQACFPYEKAAQIYSYALILCANGFVNCDQIDDFYQESILSVEFAGCSFRMGRTAINSILHELGSRGGPVRSFEQALIDGCSGNVAIDGHVVRSCSEENDLAEPGYKMNALKASQVNILIAYDTKKHIPLMYHTYRGSNVDKKSGVDFLASRSFRNTKFVGDRGFYSARMISLMSRDGNTYILALPSTSRDFKRIKKTLSFSSGEFIYRGDRKDSARIIYYEEEIDDAKRVLVFKDEDENNSKRKNYMRLIDLGEDGYTKENYDKFSPWWGVYFLETNAPDPAPVIFSDYKARWSIETYNNYIKNDAGFRNLKFQGYYEEQGFNFIMLVTGLLHSKLVDAVMSLENNSISTFDILLKAGHMRMVKNSKGEWSLQNTRTKDLQLLEAIGFIPSAVYSAMNKQP